MLLGLLILGVVGKEVIYVDLIDLPSPTPIQGLKVSVPAVAGLENRQGNPFSSQFLSSPFLSFSLFLSFLNSFLPLSPKRSQGLS